MIGRKAEKNKKMNEIIELIRTENLSMLKACEIKGVCYTTFRSWIKHNEELKKELLLSKTMKINPKYEKAIIEFLEDDISLTDLCNKYRMGITAFKNYIKSMKSEEVINQVQNKIEQRKKFNDAKFLDKDRKAIEKAYEDIKLLANGKYIFTMDMLDLLIDRNIEEPSKYFVSRLKKEGYKVI